MQSTRTFRDKIFLVLKGIGMGAANKVPGVSGGVVAFVAGFYEEFIYSLQKVNKTALKLILNGRFKSFFRYINGRFLTLLFSGMTLPGFSGSFILILLGNYVLLLVDSVNALSDTFYEMVNGDFSVFNNTERIRMLKVLVVFTVGSVVGLVSFSHLLSYILKHYKNITIASIIGFIVGSLGVVWPWKKTIYGVKDDGQFILDSAGRQVISNYERYIPTLNTETYIAIVFIIIGLAIVLALEWYAHKTRKING